MSNYPPGVTGNELEIAGPSWEGEIERSCDNTDVEIQVLGTDARLMLASPLQRSPRVTTAHDLAIQSVTVTIPECPFTDGEVYAWAHGGVLHWTCPVCGKEYEEDGRDD